MDDALRIALTRLERAGKAPTLALLKAQLGPNAYPMPVLIQALKQWKVAPQPLDGPLPSATREPQAPTLASLQQQIDALHKTVAELRQEIDRLK
ncbi:hypothetical protein [Ferrimonas balearica]|uniref:hypothetical protein n=1 Tax=Ferrimonas balearica TaxID=44012 RepID=UPI001C98FDF7|nr:hypothetical protein [Ferrimonas balearica]MBY5990642.1 hypothetical protein [Ferrimonas balearica]